MSLRAVIFDVDGVLVQSMERHHEAYRKAFAPLGVPIERHEVFANEGRRSREVIESLAKAKGLELSVDQLDAMNRAKQAAFLAFGPLPVYPGVNDLLRRLHGERFPLAAVTGTTRQNVDNHLAEVLSLLDVVVTADDVKRTKPDPEPYLSALHKLGVEPVDALVVENAPLGIRAAKAAGTRVVAVTSTLPADALREADWIVPRVADAGRIVEALR